MVATGGRIVTALIELLSGTGLKGRKPRLLAHEFSAPHCFVERSVDCNESISATLRITSDQIMYENKTRADGSASFAVKVILLSLLVATMAWCLVLGYAGWHLLWWIFD